MSKQQKDTYKNMRTLGTWFQLWNRIQLKDIIPGEKNDKLVIFYWEDIYVVDVIKANRPYFEFKECKHYMDECIQWV